MKLFVVGEEKDDPSTWSIWSEWSLVIAPDADTARRLVNRSTTTPLAEILMDKAQALYIGSEPAWGEDI